MTPASFQHKLYEARQLLLGRDFAQALSRYAKLTRTFPGQAVVWFEYGNAASRLGQLEGASRAWEKAIALQPRNAELIVQIGHQYQGLRKPEQARAWFARAAAADSKAINPRISLAVLLEQQHRLDEARAAVEECLAIDPRDDQARYFSAVLDRRENQLEAAESRLRQLIQSDPKHPYVRYACRYELAQILDRTGRLDEAMNVLAEAKQIVRTLTDTEVLLKSYDQAAESARQFALSQPKNILRAWAKSFPAQEREVIPPLAFLGGHPRSGTTLLEQVLGAHPGVAALDEPPAFAEVLEPAFCQTPEHSSARLNVLRRLYTRSLLDEIGAAGTGKLLLDKNPSLTVQLPVWLRVFPELRVVIALRDPRDVVLSCYFQNILLNATNANFLSLERLAKHYADLTDTWLAVREWEGFAWLETRYEDIVADLEKEGRRVTGFLGLDWHEEQNRFYEKSRQKQLYSPTYQDVTRPVYASSVGRWHAYEKHLAPILPVLDPYCRIVGYE
ncbi:MAG TPA: sulfotransferase [Candidatus Paceibacterota bacterium]|nr:sulfotransferase [Candidatus Paceibacterota bacterium]